jgi:arsenate reductase (thioredoxin)
MNQKIISILYVCTYWGVRSQIAQLLTESLGLPGYRAEASGLETGRIGPLPREIMRSRGLELPETSPMTLFESVREGDAYDYVVTLCNPRTQEHSEVLLSIVEQLYGTKSTVIHWEVPDFMSIKEEGEERLLAGRLIVQGIEDKVLELIDVIENVDKASPAHQRIEGCAE